MLNLNELPEQEQGENTVEPIGPGTYPARVFTVLELGVQVNDYDPKDIKHKEQVWVAFALPTEVAEYDGKELPRVIGKAYNVPKAYNDKSALLQLFNTLKKEGDSTLGDLIDYDCMITTGTTSGGKDKITGVSKIVKGMAVDEVEGSMVVSSDDWDNKEMIDKLPSFLQEMLASRV